MSRTRVKLFQINAGFLPLLDSAILIAAFEKGFDREEGIKLNLIRETSWANIRDRIAVGQFEVAHMLAPIPIAAKLGLTPIALDIIAPMALGLGGNAITVSRPLCREMMSVNSDFGLDPFAAGKCLRRVVEKRKRTNRKRLKFGVVHPFSGHSYELRYWMAGNQIDPFKDVDIVVVPPLLMPDAVKCGRIDGFGVGEPWNTVVSEQGSGSIITTKAGIWKSSPEKVLCVTETFVKQFPDELEALIRALYRAAQWCSRKENHTELAFLLAKPNFIGIEPKYFYPALSGRIKDSASIVHDISDFFIPFERAATFPWKSHALWFYSQMVRWKDADWNSNLLEEIASIYRPDIYRKALEPLGAALPSASSKVEGALALTTPVGTTHGELFLGPDGFFDGNVFDPDDVESYVLAQCGKLEL